MAFTDDDCEPAPDWLARLTAAVGVHADAAAGRTINGLPRNPLSEASQVVANYLVENSLNDSARTPFGTSNNLACMAEMFAGVPFDERYRRAGGEDRDWCARLAASGFTLIVEPKAVVVHRHRLDASGFWRQHVAYGRGAYRFRRDHEAETESPRFYARLLWTGFRRSPTVGMLVALAQVATAVGALREAVSATDSDREPARGS